jgi:hypothetical protein
LGSFGIASEENAMRYLILTALLLLSPVFAAQAQLSARISTPHVSIGINVPAYPTLVRVPGYPVYYAPSADFNYFFYDGNFWIFQDDNWYVSSWYNGPWALVGSLDVPEFILRIPVRYYGKPPVYFQHWNPTEPPPWGTRFGHNWEERRAGWDRWDGRSAPKPAPLPTYQREFSRDRYPREVDRQHEIRERHYAYQPHNPIAPQFAQGESKEQPRGRGRDRDERHDEYHDDRR